MRAAPTDCGDALRRNVCLSKPVRSELLMRTPEQFL